MCFLIDIGAKRPLLPRRRLEALSCALFVDCAGGSLDMVSLGEIAFWSLEGGDTFSCPEGNAPPPAVTHAVCVGHRHKSMACVNPLIPLHGLHRCVRRSPVKRPQGPELTGSECETTQLSTLAAARVTHVAKR